MSTAKYKASSMRNSTNKPGIVYLIGAGPGDPELLTVRGLKVLRQADVLIYDRLVNEQLLNEAPPQAERIYVGKLPGLHVLSQEEIDALLVARAQAGLVVVRLKGGDPFVFGRGGEEAEACTAAGIPWEVVPGITSAISVPAYAGIPVTYRGIAASFTVVTAQRALDFDGLKWSSLAQLETLVILMGVSNLSQIVTMLMQHGRDPQTPIAIIERGTLPDERTVVGTLGTILNDPSVATLSSPAVIVIGEVVNIRERLLPTATFPSLIALDEWMLSAQFLPS
jgi:uroporphyrin-III C-methyltransferase